MDFGPAGFGTSKWVAGVASTLGKTPNLIYVLWANSGVPRPSLEQGPAPPELCPGQQVPAGCGLKVGEGRMVEHYMWLWEASCYFQPSMHDGLFLRLPPGLRKHQWKFGKSLSTF